MQRAIDETDRRRDIQEIFNKENNITPTSIVKGVKDIMEGARSIKGKVKNKPKNLEKDLPFKIKEDTVENLSESVQKLEDQMYLFAKQMEFEKAALCRDKIKYLKRQLIDL
jgi:excinuclease ABC subunit B